MKLLLWGIIILVGLYCIDKVALWAEERGWIYYRKRHCSSGTLGNAFLAIQTALEPSKKFIFEERLKKGGETQESGDKPKPGSNT
jgi:hypothetical protein